MPEASRASGAKGGAPPFPEVSLARLLALSAFGFSIPLLHGVLEPAVYGYEVLALAPGMHNAALGVVTFAGLSVAMVTQPIVGLLSDRTRSRLGPRIPYLFAGTLLVAIGLASLVLAPSLALLVVAACLIQLGANTVQAPWQALVPDQVPLAQRGRAAAIKTILEVVSAAAGKAVGGEIMAREPVWGASAIWIAIAIPLAALVIALVITLVGAERTAAAPSAEIGLGAALRESALLVRRVRGFGAWFVNRVLFWAAFTIVATFLLFYMIDVLRFSEAEAQAYIGRVSAALGGALLVSSIAFGLLADRVDRRWLIGGGAALCAAGLFAILLVRDPWIIAGLALAIGIGTAAYMTASWALVTDLAPPEGAARFLGVANVAIAGSSALARLGAGTAIDAINAWAGDRSSGYHAVYGLAGLMLLASSIVAIRLPRRVNRS